MQEKEELLAEIKHYQKVVNEYVSLQNEYSGYHRKPFSDFSIWKRIGIFFIVYIILSVENYYVSPNLDPLVLIGFFCFFFIWPSIYRRMKLSRNKERIHQINLLIADIEDSVNPKYVPGPYLSKHALLKLESYLVNKRADTLKEALNLYEQEKRHDKQMREINTMQQLQGKTYREAQKTNRLLSRLNTYRQMNK